MILDASSTVWHNFVLFSSSCEGPAVCVEACVRVSSRSEEGRRRRSNSRCSLSLQGAPAFSSPSPRRPSRPPSGWWARWTSCRGRKHETDSCSCCRKLWTFSHILMILWQMVTEPQCVPHVSLDSWVKTCSVISHDLTQTLRCQQFSVNFSFWCSWIISR